MNQEQIQEAEIAENTAIAVREASPVGKALPPSEIKPAITPAQAKIEAVAALTMAAYERAATLKLTPEESAALQADFPDEAFQPGAAGKENLIYIEHAYLRDRFTSVFGLGQWAIIPRNRWAESFKTQRNEEASRVYVEAMLVVRGCFVGEAVGAMEYYPKNASQNYGDAVEGAKTAAFRRCAKEFGVGLQAWKKEWCQGWWERKRSGARAPTPRAQAPTPAPAAKPATHLAPTAEQRTKMIALLEAGEGQNNRELVTEYFRKAGMLMPIEQLEELPLRWVPATQKQMLALNDKIAGFGNGEEAVKPYPANEEAGAAKKPAEVPREDFALTGDEWRTFPMPWGAQAGTALEDLEKKYLFGLWANYTVETEYQGKPKKPETIAKDTKFREMLDQAGEHYQFTKKD